VNVGQTQFGMSITLVAAGSGAAQAGLQVGDQLIAIDTEPVDDMALDAVIRNLMGPIGSTAALAVKRVNGHVERIEVARRRLPKPPAY
jgi:C-terminal processing protease CtpA/Prc